MEKHPVFSLSQFMTIFADMPLGQMVFLALFAGTWLIGGNILVARHYKRLGKSPWSGFKPFAFPFEDHEDAVCQTCRPERKVVFFVI
jgi:hypothetical protein